jgi:hypothetical protein
MWRKGLDGMEAWQDTSLRTTVIRDVSKHLRKDPVGDWHKILDEMDLGLSFIHRPL